MTLKTKVLALVLMTVLSSAAFGASPAASHASQNLLTEIFAPAAPAVPASAVLPPVLNSICSPCTQANCTRICHQTAFCSFDPDTGCSFCSCFVS